KARTLSWALTFFLANKRPDGLKRYHEELKKLPRDLEFDADTLLVTFARAFDCLDAARPNLADRTKLEKLANEWHDYLMLQRSEGQALVEELVKAQAELKGRHFPKPPNDQAPKP